MTYNDIINIYNGIYDDGNKLWTYDRIIDHSKASGGKHEVQVMWYTGEKIQEPMQDLKEDDKITISEYAKKRVLLDTPGWKWARRLTKNSKKFIIMARIFFSKTNIKINK